MSIKTPNIDSFIETLSKLGKGKFTTDDDGHIRYNPVARNANCVGLVCPIEYIAARSNHKAVDEYYGFVHLAASLLGLNQLDRGAIVCAADHRQSREQTLRKRMLVAVGL